MLCSALAFAEINGFADSGVTGMTANALYDESSDANFNCVVIDGNKIEIISFGGFNGDNTDLVIPEEIDGMLVSSIAGEAFSGCEGITSISIPDTVMHIGDNAFSYCGSLEEVTIGIGAKEIPDHAFMGCTSLKKVTIGRSVERIGEFAFSGCMALEDPEIPDSVTSIGDNAFVGCVSLKQITLLLKI